MIYLKCPTCGYILGNRQKIYEKGLEEIESNRIHPAFSVLEEYINKIAKEKWQIQ